MPGSILARQDRVSLGNGFDLRLLSALEVLQAHREGGELAERDEERRLCSSACLIARALEKTEDKTPVFSSGQEVLAGLTAEEIGALTARWEAFSQESVPELEEAGEETPEGARSATAEQAGGPDGLPTGERPENAQADEAAPEKPGLPERRGNAAPGPAEEQSAPAGAYGPDDGEALPERRAGEPGAPEAETAARPSAFLEAAQQKARVRAQEAPAARPARAALPEEALPLPASAGAVGGESGPSAVEQDELYWAEQADRAFRRDSRRYDGGFYLY